MGGMLRITREGRMSREGSTSREGRKEGRMSREGRTPLYVGKDGTQVGKMGGTKDRREGRKEGRKTAALKVAFASLFVFSAFEGTERKEKGTEGKGFYINFWFTEKDQIETWEFRCTDKKRPRTSEGWDR
jgi:hypothetical protein